jgi:hypothetical protein
MQRSASCPMLHLKRIMSKWGSSPALMHTAPLLAPVAKPWAVVAHVVLVGDAHLASVRLARAVQGQTLALQMLARRSTVKLQSSYLYEMKECIPPVADLPSVEVQDTHIFFLKKKEKKCTNSFGYISPPNCTGTQKC